VSAQAELAERGRYNRVQHDRDTADKDSNKAAPDVAKLQTALMQAAQYRSTNNGQNGTDETKVVRLHILPTQVALPRGSLVAGMSMQNKRPCSHL
jgi:hypothetical protein